MSLKCPDCGSHMEFVNNVPVCPECDPVMNKTMNDDGWRQGSDNSQE